MAEVLGEKGKKEAKKEAMKEILKELHRGLPLEEAKKRFLSEIGNISSVEIAEIEQSLINEGISIDIIKEFCNVHSLLFESTLKEAVKSGTKPNHPVFLFNKENREIEKLVNSIEESINVSNIQDFKTRLKEKLEKLKEIDKHYERKEQLLFPYLEKYNFMGPSKVMWGKHNDIRALWKKAVNEIDAVNESNRKKFINEVILPLIDEVLGMITKEENILFPTALEKLSDEDWIEILKQSDEIGYCFIDVPKNIQFIIDEYNTVLSPEVAIKDNSIVQFPTGELTARELNYIINTLPVDITFIDSEDRVKYFSDNKTRIFTRTKSVIGRKVQNCHPPKSVDAVEKILKSFRDGTKNSYDFWLNIGGRFIYIRYFAVRDKNRNYLGTLEVTQDITDVRKLEGEKRLLDMDD